MDTILWNIMQLLKQMGCGYNLHSKKSRITKNKARNKAYRLAGMLGLEK